MSFTQPSPRQMRSISALHCSGLEVAAAGDESRETATGEEPQATVVRGAKLGPRCDPQLQDTTGRHLQSSAGLAVGKATGAPAGVEMTEPCTYPLREEEPASGDSALDAIGSNGVLSQLFNQALVHGWSLENTLEAVSLVARTEEGANLNKVAGEGEHSEVQGQQPIARDLHNSSSPESTSDLLPSSLLPACLGSQSSGQVLDADITAQQRAGGSPAGGTAHQLHASNTHGLLGEFSMTSASPGPQLVSPELLHLLHLLQQQQQQDVLMQQLQATNSLLDPNQASMFNQGSIPRATRPGNQGSPNGGSPYDEQQAREHMLNVLTAYLSANITSAGHSGAGRAGARDVMDPAHTAALNSLLQQGAEPDLLYQAMMSMKPPRLPTPQHHLAPHTSLFSSPTATGRSSAAAQHSRQAYATGCGSNGMGMGPGPVAGGGGGGTGTDTCSWDDLTQEVRETVLAMISRCEPHIKLVHFDGGVRHWLAQLSGLFGESAALSGLAAIEGATNLAGVRNMRAFITCKLIDHFEQHVFQQDPAGYASKRLSADQFAMLSELVMEGNGLQWRHFDPKVLDTIRDLGSVEYVRSRLQRLTSKELAAVQNVPAYIFTLLSKRGKTAKQAAAAKGATEAALAALVDSALAKQVTGLSLNNIGTPSSSLHSQVLSPGPGIGSMMLGSAGQQQRTPLQRSWTTGLPPGPSMGSSLAAGSALFHSPAYDRLANTHMHGPGLTPFYPQAHLLHQGFAGAGGAQQLNPGMHRFAQGSMPLPGAGGLGLGSMDSGVGMADRSGWLEDVHLGRSHSNLGLGAGGAPLGMSAAHANGSNGLHPSLLSSLYSSSGSFTLNGNTQMPAFNMDGGVAPQPHPAYQYSTWG